MPALCFPLKNTTLIPVSATPNIKVYPFPNSPILECEVKWALESITTNKASGGDGIPVELFQILKDDAVKVLHAFNMPANLENSAVATGLEKFSFHCNP